MRAPAVVCKCRLIVIFDFLRNVVSGGVWAATGRPYGMNCAKQKATVRRGRTPGHLLLPCGQFTLSHPTVKHEDYIYRCAKFAGAVRVRRANELRDTVMSRLRR